MSTPALRDIMALVDDLAGACTPEGRNICRSLIAFKVAQLTGDRPQDVFEALRDPPPSALKAPAPHRAAKASPAETLEQVVESIVDVLKLRKAGM